MLWSFPGMIRSNTSITSVALTIKPVSSSASRSAAARKVSPNSTAPPGSDHSPCIGGRARFTSSTRPLSIMTAPTPTIGRSGYSRLLMGSKRSSVEKCSGLDVGKLPSVTAVFRDEAELRLPTDRRRRAVVLFQFHFHVDHGDASAILHGSLTHVEVEVHGIVAVEECH